MPSFLSALSNSPRFSEPLSDCQTFISPGIDHVTAKAGLKVSIMPKEATIKAMVDEIIKWAAKALVAISKFHISFFKPIADFRHDIMLLIA